MDHHDGPITVKLFPPGAIHNGGAQVKTGAAAEADTDDNKFLVFARSITNVVLIIVDSIGHIFNTRSNYIFVCQNYPNFIHFEPSAMPRTKASPKKCVKSQVANNTLLLILKGNRTVATSICVLCRLRPSPLS
jgi:hypothetical protein